MHDYSFKQRNAGNVGQDHSSLNPRAVVSRREILSARKIAFGIRQQSGGVRLARGIIDTFDHTNTYVSNVRREQRYVYGCVAERMQAPRFLARSRLRHPPTIAMKNPSARDARRFVRL